MKTKAVVFDFDGTLTKPHRLSNSWARVWDRIGCNDIDDVLYGRFNRGEITYEEWFYLCYDCFKEHKVNMQHFVDIADEIELLDHMEEYFKTLNNSGVKIYVLSGGVGNIVDIKLQSVNKYITSIEADRFVLDEGGDLCGATLSDSRLEKKSFFVNKLMKTLGINRDEVVFIGNGCNDEEVYTTGVKTICINPDNNAHPDNRMFWTISLGKCDDIRKTLEFID